MKRIKIDDLSAAFIILFVIAQNLLLNGFYLFLCCCIGLFLVSRLSQPYKPAIFTIIALNHLLQIVAAVLLANYLDKDIDYRSFYTSRATVLSLIGLVFLLAPVIYEQNRIKKISLEEFKKQAFRFSSKKSLNCYITALIAATFLSGLAFIFSGLTQVIVSIVKIKWFFFLLFGYQVLLKKEKLTVFYVLIAIEFLSGFYSFFSDFKTVFYYIGVVLISLIATVNFRQLLFGISIVVCLVYMSLLWTSVKSEYRDFLNKGSNTQNVKVTKDEAVNQLIVLSNQQEEKGVGGATENLLDRLQYTYHFSKTMEKVPDFIPFQNGANWLDNIEFATTPRFLNPDKPTIDNSVKATKYTGINYATAKQGVSFSLGYFAEFYIDFGPYMMMPMLLVLGFIYSRLYRYFMKKPSDNPVFNYSIAGAFFFEFSNFEMDGTYLAGRFFASTVTFFLLIYFFSKPLLRYITIRKEEERYD